MRLAGIGDASFLGSPGINRLHAMCASRTYAGKLPINHPTLSPLQAPLYLSFGHFAQTSAKANWQGLNLRWQWHRLS